MFPTQSTTCLSSNIKTFLLERETAMNIPPRDAISRGCIDNIAAGIFCCQSNFPFVDIQDNLSSIEATRIVFSWRTMPTVKLSRFTRIFAVELPRFNEQILPLRHDATILYKEKSSIDCYDVSHRSYINSNMIFVKMLACNLRHTVLLQINVLVDSGRP